MFLNKLQLIRVSDAEKQIDIFTRSPEQYTELRTELRTELGTELQNEDLHSDLHSDLGLIVEEC